ncbi:MAG: hypothetical protein ABEH35_05605 [Haloarculaceae archaeon]
MIGDTTRQLRRDRRGQLPLSLLEAAVGISLILGVALGFALGVPAPDTREPQLDAYAEDVVTVLASEQPRHQGATRLSETIRSPAAFARERAALERRVDRLLPDNVMYRVETPHGAVGYRKPSAVVTGEATVTTVNGAVTVRVWYV